MRRLMIVDDEPIIVDGLYEYFNKVDLPDLEVLKADSAEQALEWMNTLRVDVVLSDIFMPGMDGMELIREIMDRWPRCKVILLTGHNEFDYAHQAIRNPCVVDYLLKTEGMDKIYASLTAALEQLASEEEYQYQTQWVRYKLPRAMPQLQQQLMNDVMRRTEKTEESRLQEEFDAIQLPFQAAQAVIPLIIRIESWQDYELSTDRTLIRYAVINIAEELLGDKAESKAIDYDSSTIACVVQPRINSYGAYTEEEYWIKALRYVHGMMEAIQQACDNYLRLSVSVIAGSHAISWHELNHGLNRLRLASYDSPGLGMQKLLKVNILEPARQQKLLQGRLASTGVLLDYLKQHLLDGTSEWRDSFHKWATLAGEGGIEEPFMRWKMLSGISNTSLEVLEEMGLMEQALQEKDLSDMLRFNIDTPWVAVISFFQSLLEWIAANRRASFRKDESSILLMIHQYIKFHLSDNLSLTRIAQEVSLNPSYLSRWYKRATGKSLSDYIAEKKLELSKELLLGTALKMHEISDRLGFSDQHYFFRFFKKTAGCTPQEFREQRRNKA